MFFLFEHIGWNRDEEERLRIRKKHEVPIIDNIACEKRLHQGKALPQSKLAINK